MLLKFLEPDVELRDHGLIEHGFVVVHLLDNFELLRRAIELFLHLLVQKRRQIQRELLQPHTLHKQVELFE